MHTAFAITQTVRNVTWSRFCVTLRVEKVCDVNFWVEKKNKIKNKRMSQFCGIVKMIYFASQLRVFSTLR